MVFKLTELLQITKAAMDTCHEFGYTFEQIQDLEIRLEPVKPNGTTHFSLRRKNIVIPEYKLELMH